VASEQAGLVADAAVILIGGIRRAEADAPTAVVWAAVMFVLGTRVMLALDARVMLVLDARVMALSSMPTMVPARRGQRRGPAGQQDNR
jgi:hypothetical protein